MHGAQIANPRRSPRRHPAPLETRLTVALRGGASRLRRHPTLPPARSNPVCRAAPRSPALLHTPLAPAAVGSERRGGRRGRWRREHGKPGILLLPPYLAARVVALRIPAGAARLCKPNSPAACNAPAPPRTQVQPATLPRARGGPTIRTKRAKSQAVRSGRAGNGRGPGVGRRPARPALFLSA